MIGGANSNLGVALEKGSVASWKQDIQTLESLLLLPNFLSIPKHFLGYSLHDIKCCALAQQQKMSQVKFNAVCRPLIFGWMQKII